MHVTEIKFEKSEVQLFDLKGTSKLLELDMPICTERLTLRTHGRPYFELQRREQGARVAQYLIHRSGVIFADCRGQSCKN